MSPTAKSTPIDRERSVLRVSWNWPPENFMEGSSSVGEIRWSLVQNIRVRKLGIPPQSIFTLRFWKQLHLKYRLKVVVYTCVFYLFSRVWNPSVQVDTSLNFGDTLEDMLFRQVLPGSATIRHRRWAWSRKEPEQKQPKPQKTVNEHPWEC